jgi:hypothetical protein
VLSWLSKDDLAPKGKFAPLITGWGSENRF